MKKVYVLSCGGVDIEAIIKVFRDFFSEQDISFESHCYAFKAFERFVTEAELLEGALSMVNFDEAEKAFLGCDFCVGVLHGGERRSNSMWSSMCIVVRNGSGEISHAFAEKFPEEYVMKEKEIFNWYVSAISRALIPLVQSMHADRDLNKK